MLVWLGTVTKERCFIRGALVYLGEKVGPHIKQCLLANRPPLLRFLFSKVLLVFLLLGLSISVLNSTLHISAPNTSVTFPALAYHHTFLSHFDRFHSIPKRSIGHPTRLLYNLLLLHHHVVLFKLYLYPTLDVLRSCFFR
jgi:hypothetical protein